jgi:4-amino-4-deoxy-L-arabinose transferase-like glycosyltransferase
MPRSEEGAGAAAMVERFIDRLATSPWASGAAILIVALACFLPGFTTIPPLDREETQFVEAARQMVATGNYGHIEQLIDTGRLEPIGMYWLEAASAWMAGEGRGTPIWIYRLPALLGAIAAALGTWWMALAFGRPRAALLAGLLIAANIVLAGEARLARPDAMLLAAIVLAEGALARLWLKENGKPSLALAAVFWLSIGFGILLKGPIAPLVLGLTVAALAYQRRRARWLRRLQPQWGIPLMLLVILPWIVAIASFEAGSPGGEARADFLLKLGGEIDPRAPPGSYALLLAAIFFPGASFFALGVPWLLQHIRHPAIFFGIAWAAPFWLVTELFPNKLPHFMLPAFPALPSSRLACLGCFSTSGTLRSFSESPGLPLSGWSQSFSRTSSPISCCRLSRRLPSLPASQPTRARLG